MFALCNFLAKVSSCVTMMKIQHTFTKLDISGEISFVHIRVLSISDSTVNLTDLETLDLTDNQLNSLPVNFYKMTGLKSAHTYQKIHKHGLWLHKNPLTVPPQHIWKTDKPSKIYTYMKKLQVSFSLCNVQSHIYICKQYSN